MSAPLDPEIVLREPSIRAKVLELLRTASEAQEPALLAQLLQNPTFGPLVRHVIETPGLLDTLAAESSGAAVEREAEEGAADGGAIEEEEFDAVEREAHAAAADRESLRFAASDEESDEAADRSGEPILDGTDTLTPSDVLASPGMREKVMELIVAYDEKGKLGELLQDKVMGPLARSVLDAARTQRSGGQGAAEAAAPAAQAPRAQAPTLDENQRLMLSDPDVRRKLGELVVQAHSAGSLEALLEDPKLGPLCSAVIESGSVGGEQTGKDELRVSMALQDPAMRQRVLELAVRANRSGNLAELLGNPTIGPVVRALLDEETAGDDDGDDDGGDDQQPAAVADDAPAPVAEAEDEEELAGGDARAQLALLSPEMRQRLTETVIKAHEEGMLEDLLRNPAIGPLVTALLSEQADNVDDDDAADEEDGEANGEEDGAYDESYEDDEEEGYEREAAANGAAWMPQMPGIASEPPQPPPRQQRPSTRGNLWDEQVPHDDAAHEEPAEGDDSLIMSLLDSHPNIVARIEAALHDPEMLAELMQDPTLGPVVRTLLKSTPDGPQ